MLQSNDKSSTAPKPRSKTCPPDGSHNNASYRASKFPLPSIESNPAVMCESTGKGATVEPKLGPSSMHMGPQRPHMQSALPVKPQLFD